MCANLLKTKSLTKAFAAMLFFIIISVRQSSNWKAIILFVALFVGISQPLIGSATTSSPIKSKSDLPNTTLGVGDSTIDESWVGETIVTEARINWIWQRELTDNIVNKLQPVEITNLNLLSNGTFFNL